MKTGPTLLMILLLLMIGAACGGDDAGVAGGPEFERFAESRFGFFRGGGSYGYMQELGVHWQRAHPGPFVWGLVEKEEGSYDWSEADLFVSEAQDHQVLLLATIWPYADWDQQRCHEKLAGAPFRFLPTLGDYRARPCDMEAYGDFVEAMVERYDGDGEDDMPGLVYPVKYWEVINEPDLETDVPFFSGDPEGNDYREMLLFTAGVIREADPQAKVLNGGISALGAEQVSFWKTVFGGEGADAVDVVTVHAVIETSVNNLKLLNGVMSGMGMDQPVWVTEIRTARGEGSAGHEERGGAGTEQSFTPEEVAAQERMSVELVKEFVAAFGEGADKLFYMGLDNATPTAEAARLVNCGVVIGGELEEDRLVLEDCVKQKPFFAFKTMAARLDYFESVEKLAEGQYLFMVEGHPVYILWGEGLLPAEIGARAAVSDIYGEEHEVAADDIVLTDSPIYVEPV